MNDRSTDPRETAILKRAAALRQHAAMTPEEASAHTANARAAFEQKWLDQAGGDPERAAKLRRAYFLELAVKSARARRAAREKAEMDEVASIVGEVA
jgi:hypothetical protein